MNRGVTNIVVVAVIVAMILVSALGHYIYSDSGKASKIQRA